MPDSVPNIVITGFMGTGKSTVAPIVAQCLNRLHIETDALIVQREQRTIPQIFADDGEAYFRQLERDICRELAQRNGLVISTGGGMLVNAENRQLMVTSGFVICLTAPPDVIEQRLRNTTDRPLAAGWRELLAQRRAAYAQIPYQIDTTGKAPADIAQEVIDLCNASR